MARSSLGPGLDGILVVAKPAGPTSHDVVALVRRLAVEKDATVVVTLHALDMAVKYADAMVFLKAGGLLFGSGYVLLAFLRADLVERLHWLTESQLLDAIAIGQATPGPVFTTLSASASCGISPARPASACR